MTLRERARFYMGLAMLVALVGIVLGAAWVVVSLLTLATLPANGVWLLVVLLLAISAALAFRSHVHSEAARREDARQRQKMREMRERLDNIGGRRVGD